MGTPSFIGYRHIQIIREKRVPLEKKITIFSTIESSENDDGFKSNNRMLWTQNYSIGSRAYGT